MKKNILMLMLLLLMLTALFFSCQGEVLWTNVPYSGKVTSTDLDDGSYYFDRYYVGVGGTWQITFESEDDIYMYCNCWDELTGIKKYSKYTNGKIVFTARMPANFHISVCVKKTYDSFIDNGNSASYSLLAVLQ